MINSGKLAGKTVFITGASRGIGKSIALKLAKDGANVVIAAKSAKPHPKLDGTIYTTAEEVEKSGGKALPCVVDVSNESQIQAAVNEAVKKFGGIDIVVNNASAVNLASTEKQEMKRYDLMQSINTRGTFLVSKLCIPYLKKSNHAHILNLSPPLDMSPRWFGPHVAYTISKYGMSMCVLGLSEELKPHNIAVNALWPRTLIWTSALEMLRGPESAKNARKPEIVSDAAYAILSQDPKLPKSTGNFYMDEVVLKENGVTNLDQYCMDPERKNELVVDLFVAGFDFEKHISNDVKQEVTPKSSTTGDVAGLFEKIRTSLSEEIVKNTDATFHFVVTGKEEGKWYLDMKSGAGSCGKGENPTGKPDATLQMDSENFFKMFTGKMKPATAYMTGKLKISGNLQKALKLEKLMTSLRTKL